jgi:hypothetical protein
MIADSVRDTLFQFRDPLLHYRALSFPQLALFGKGDPFPVKTQPLALKG